MNAILKLLEPMLEQFKPQIEEYAKTIKVGVDTLTRIESKLDNLIATQEHHALQIEELMAEKATRSKYDG